MEEDVKEVVIVVKNVMIKMNKLFVYDCVIILEKVV